MKITVFTSNSIRHNYLCQTLHEFSSELNIIQEIDTVHIGKNQINIKKYLKPFINILKKYIVLKKKFLKKIILNCLKRKQKLLILKWVT